MRVPGDHRQHRVTDHTRHASTRYEAAAMADAWSRRINAAVYFWRNQDAIDTRAGVMVVDAPEGGPLAWTVSTSLDEAVKHDAEVVRPVNPPEIYGRGVEDLH